MCNFGRECLVSAILPPFFPYVILQLQSIGWTGPVGTTKSFCGILVLTAKENFVSNICKCLNTLTKLFEDMKFVLITFIPGPV